jgi:predicted enzyme related to lactoylglutathione lyase
VLRLDHITFACEDPKRLAAFWAEFLDGYTAEDSGGSWRAVGEGPTLLFNEMEKSPTIELPIHVDVNVPDREAELTRVLKLGGHLVATKTHRMGDFETTWTVMRDPERNGFCIEKLENAPPQRHISNVTFACAEPRELGRFCANALGWPDEDIDAGFLQQFRDAGVDERQVTSFHLVRQPEGRRPRFLFQRREKSRPVSYPIHLDFGTDDREAEIERLTGAGASVVETKVGTNITFTVMRDPEGNPFCVG